MFEAWALQRSEWLLKEPFVEVRFGSGCSLLGSLLGLLGQQDGLDVGQHAALSDGDSSEQLVELLVVADGELQVSGDDSGLLVVAGGVSGQLQDLGGQVLQHRRQVDRSSGPDTLSVVPLPEQPVDAADWELQPGPGRAALGLGSNLTGTFSSSRHDATSHYTVSSAEEVATDRRHPVYISSNCSFIGYNERNGDRPIRTQLGHFPV